MEPFFLDLIAGLEEALQPHGAAVLLLVAPDLAAELAAYERWARDGTVGAVVVVNLVHDDVRPARLAALGLTAVLAGRHGACRLLLAVPDLPALAALTLDRPGLLGEVLPLAARLRKAHVATMPRPGLLLDLDLGSAA